MCEGHRFFGFLCHFFVAFRLIPPFRLLRFYVKKFTPENGDGLFKPFLPPQCLRLCIILSSNKLEYLSFFDKIGLWWNLKTYHYEFIENFYRNGCLIRCVNFPIRYLAWVFLTTMKTFLRRFFFKSPEFYNILWPDTILC